MAVLQSYLSPISYHALVVCVALVRSELGLQLGTKQQTLFSNKGQEDNPKTNTTLVFPTMGGARRYGWSGFSNTAEYFKSLPSTFGLFSKRAGYVRSGEAQAADKAAGGVEMAKVRLQQLRCCCISVAGTGLQLGLLDLTLPHTLPCRCLPGPVSLCLVLVSNMC